MGPDSLLTLPDKDESLCEISGSRFNYCASLVNKTQFPTYRNRTYVDVSKVYCHTT